MLNNIRGLLGLLAVVGCTFSFAQTVEDLSADLADDDLVSLQMRDVALNEVMQMLSQAARVNILLAENVAGTVSVNLFDMTIDDAIESIASAAGFALERRNNSYFVVQHQRVGEYHPGSPTELRTFKVQYTDPSIIQGILESHLSNYGSITSLAQRGLIVVEDTPFFLAKIARLLKALDRKPQQIFIEARILEIGLNSSESFGLDWTDLFSSNEGTGSFGIQGLSNPGSPGLFFQLATPDVEVFLDTLRTRDRLRTLSTPKILAMENEESETIIGDRLGYNVTTTIDGVTTTSVEYLESGVILRVKPTVDEQNRILLNIHPEVSTGTVSDDGIPNQSTTEVTTSMLVNSGETVFIGGLIKRTSQTTREGVPVLGDVPLVGRLFSNRAERVVSTELVVLITPYLIEAEGLPMDAGNRAQVQRLSDELTIEADAIEAFFTNPANK